MNRRSARRFRPAFASLESRRLLSETGVSINQDGQDYVAEAPGLHQDGFQDADILIKDIPIGADVVNARIQPPEGGLYSSIGSEGHYGIKIIQHPAQTLDDNTVDLYFQPSDGLAQVGQNYTVTLLYSNLASATVQVKLTSALDPNLRVPGESVTIAPNNPPQPGMDIESASTDIGSDGFRDYVLQVAGIATPPTVHQQYYQWVSLTWTSLSDPHNQITWYPQPEIGARPAGDWAADLIVSGDRATSGTFYFQPPISGLGPGNLQLKVHYYTGQEDQSAPIPFSSYVPNDPAPQPPSFTLSTSSISAKWGGQQTSDRSVDVKLAGLPTDPGLAANAVVLSNDTKFMWLYQAPGYTLPNSGGIPTIPLRLVPSATDATKADLYFAPNRDEVNSTIASGSPLLLRIVFANGTSTVVPFSGGACDPNLYNPATAAPPITPYEVHPTDAPNLSSILTNHPWVQLSGGVYSLASSLIISHPVTITTDPGADAIFQFTNAAPSSGTHDFLEIEASHVHLSGFTIDFSGAWNFVGNDYSPTAVIGIQKAVAGGTPLADIEIDQMTIETAPLSQHADYNGVVAIRTDQNSCGTIEGSTFIGQGVDIDGGPWLVEGNDYQGTLAGVTINQAFTLDRHAHDVIIENNKVHQDNPDGTTSKFLEVRAALNCQVIGNYVYGGMGAGPGTPNQPEMILADATRPYFVGKPTSISTDGRVLQIGTLRGSDHPFPTLVVSIISADYTVPSEQNGTGKRWYRVAQVVDDHTLIMEDPLPAGDYYISLNDGYVDDSYSYNTIVLPTSDSGSREAFQLDGGQFGTVVKGNDIENGAGPSFGSYFIQSPPDPSHSLGPPAPAAWYPAPAYDFTVEGNTFQDTVGTMQFETGSGNPNAGGGSQFPGFFLFTGAFTDNTFVYHVGQPVNLPILIGGSAVPWSGSTYSILVSGNDVVQPSGEASTLSYLNTQGPSHQGTTPGPITLPNAPNPPTNLVATAGANPGQIQLTWDAIASALGYEVDRSATGIAGWQEVAAPSETPSSSYLDAGLSAGQYYYRVRALTAGGYSEFTNSVEGTAVSGGGQNGAVLHLQGMIIDPVSASSTSQYNGNVARDTIDGSGLSSPLPTGAETPTTYPTVDNTFDHNWVSANGNGDSGTEALTFQLVNPTDAPVNLSGFHLWAYSADQPQRSIKTADVWTSPDGSPSSYTLRGTYTLYEGKNAADAGLDYTLSVQGVRYVKFTNIASYGSDVFGDFAGLAEIRFIAAPQLQGTIIDPVSASSTSQYNGNGAVYTIDGSGLSSPLPSGVPTPTTYPTVDTTFNNNWVSANPDGQSGAEVLKFQLVQATDAPVDLAGFHLWAYSADQPQRSIMTVTVWTSPDDSPSSYTSYGTHTFYEGKNAADAGEDYALSATGVRYVKFTDIKNYDPDHTDPYGSFAGLSEIRFIESSQGTLVDRSTNAGGTASAKNSNPPNQVPANLFDGNLATTWLDFEPTSWVQYQFANNAAYVITEYAITSGRDTATYPGRAPKNWVLEASNNPGDNNAWVVLDTQANQADILNVDTKTYKFTNSTAYQVYRLVITQSNGDKIVQLTELKLLGA